MFNTTAGDLRDVRSTDTAVAGMDTIIHSASYIGNDPVLCAEINISGTANLVQSAQRLGVPNLIYISTTSVYGSGPHRGARAELTATRPASVLSKSRLTAERIVLDAGGAVIRPALVYGTNDKWVIPTLARLTARIGGLVDGGKARVSIIRVGDLGALVEAAARELPALQLPMVWHAANTRPVLISELFHMIRNVFSLDPAGASVTRAEALMATRALNLSAHQLDLVSVDHSYESTQLWALAGRTSPITPLRLTGRELRWYRTLDRP